MFNIFKNWVAKQLFKKSGTIPDSKSVDFSTDALIKRLSKYNIKPDDITSEEQLLKVLASVKQAEDNVFNNRFKGIMDNNIFNKNSNQKSADVLDLKGNKIKNTDNIMGGEELLGETNIFSNKYLNDLDKQIIDSDAFGYTQKEWNNLSNSSKEKFRKQFDSNYEDAMENTKMATLKAVESEAEILERLNKGNREGIDSLKKKLDEPDDMATGGRAGYVEGGPIHPRLGELSSGVSSAEEQLQQINQSLKTAETSLGESGPGGAGSVTPSVNGYESSGSSLYNESPAGEVSNPYQAPVGMDPKTDFFAGNMFPVDNSIDTKLPIGPGKIDNQGQDPFRDPITGGGQPFYGQPGVPANPYDNGGGLGGLLGEGGGGPSIPTLTGTGESQKAIEDPNNPGSLMPINQMPMLPPDKQNSFFGNAMPATPIATPGPSLTQTAPKAADPYNNTTLSGLSQDGQRFDSAQNAFDALAAQTQKYRESSPYSRDVIGSELYQGEEGFKNFTNYFNKINNPNYTAPQLQGQLQSENQFRIKSIEERKQIAEDMNNSSGGLGRADGTRVPITYEQIADGRNTMPSMPYKGNGGMGQQNTMSPELPYPSLEVPGMQFRDGGRAGYYMGGQAMVGEDLSDIGHGSDSLMARNMQISPGSQATTSTGLNYLLGQDNDTARVPYNEGKKVEGPNPKVLELMLNEKMSYSDALKELKIREKQQPYIDQRYNMGPGPILEAAEGGRIGYKDAGPVVLPKEKPNSDFKSLLKIYNNYKDSMPGVSEDTQKYLEQDFINKLNEKGLSQTQFQTLRMQNHYEENKAEGGRIGYNKGKAVKKVVDEGRRGFMKAAGGVGAGIAALKTGLLGFGEKAAPVVEKVAEAAQGVPPYFMKLVEKITKLGEDITQFSALSERQTVKKFKDYEMTTDNATGKIEIQRYKVSDEASYYDQPLTEETYMSYTPGMVDEATKIKPKGEYEEGTAFLRNDREFAGEVVEESTTISDDIFKEVGEELPEAVRKTKAGDIINKNKIGEYADGGRIGFGKGDIVTKGIPALIKAGEGKFTKAQYLIERIKNTIKGSPDDKYVQETFPGFIKELEANPDLAKNENVFKELGGDLPEGQQIVVYGDDTLDFFTQKSGPGNIDRLKKLMEKHDLSRERALEIMKMEPNDQVMELTKTKFLKQKQTDN